MAKRHLPHILIFVVLLIVMLAVIFLWPSKRATPPPVEEEGILFLNPPYQTAAYHDFGELARPLSTPVEDRLRIYPDISVNGHAISAESEFTVIGDTIYVAALPVLRALVPMAKVTTGPNGVTELTDTNFYCNIKVSDPFFQINEQYFYVAKRVRAGENGPLLPLWVLADALGCTIRQDENTGHIALRQVCPVFKTYLYDEEGLYWLSHIIYAESGNQDMPGRVAVGTVVMNRLKNDAFPDTIKEIVFEEGQFSPVDNGTIYLEPDEWSVIAAKICLSGQREAGDCLYFNVSSLRSWAYYNRPYVCTIGGHSFFL